MPSIALAMVASIAPAPAIGMPSPVAVAIAIATLDVADPSRQEARAVTLAAAPVKADARGPTDTRDASETLKARRLAMPVAGVTRSSLQDTYSDRRGSGAHEAIDIPAPRGTPVVAVDDGRIVKLFTSVPGGLTIYQFDSDRRFAYYYAHLDRYAEGVREGNTVTRGDLIGYVGSTGNASPGAPHLHFAIFVLGPEKQWWRGTAINPLPLLRGTSP